MKIPKPVLVDPGDSGPIYRQIDDFFISVREEIKKSIDIPPGPSPFKIEIKDLYGQQAIYTDDKAHLLLHKERVAAIVTEIRNDANYIQFNFFKNLEGIAESL